MPGEWDEALRLLRPSMDAADQAAQAAQGREAWLRDVVLPRSNQYGHQISGAVGYFLQAIATHRPDALDAIRSGKTGAGIDTVRGFVSDGRHYDKAYWRFPVDAREWPGKTQGDGFVVYETGRWYFGHMNDLGGDIGSVHDIVVYGFDHESRWIPSAFPPVEAGTVVEIVRMNLVALMHHYHLPLPS